MKRMVLPASPCQIAIKLKKCLIQIAWCGLLLSKSQPLSLLLLLLNFHPVIASLPPSRPQTLHSCFSGQQFLCALCLYPVQALAFLRETSSHSYMSSPTPALILRLFNQGYLPSSPASDCRKTSASPPPTHSKPSVVTNTHTICDSELQVNPNPDGQTKP